MNPTLIELDNVVNSSMCKMSGFDEKFSDALNLVVANQYQL